MMNYLFEICIFFIFIWAIIGYNKGIEKEKCIFKKNRNSHKRINREIIKFANTKPMYLYY